MQFVSKLHPMYCKCSIRNYIPMVTKQSRRQKHDRARYMVVVDPGAVLQHSYLSWLLPLFLSVGPMRTQSDRSACVANRSRV